MELLCMYVTSAKENLEYITHTHSPIPFFFEKHSPIPKYDIFADL